MTTAVMRCLLVICFALLCAGAEPGPDLTRAIETMELDPAECYRVREVSILRDEARTFFTDGYLIFAKPVDGHRIAAVFTANVDGGDAELLLMPPVQAERKALAAFAKAPNLDEHFTAGLLLFGDDTYADLMQQIRGGETNRKASDKGAELADTWNPVVTRLSASFATRLALELLSQHSGKGFFNEILSSRSLGNIDLVFDPRSSEQIVLGKLRDQGARAFFETWTSFESNSYRHRPSPPDVVLEHYRIQAKLDAQLHLSCTSTLTIRIDPVSRFAIPLELSAQMRISRVTVDGIAGRVVDSGAVRTDLLDDARDRLFLVVPEQRLDPAVPHEVGIEHEGDVISAAGGNVFFVGSRGRWYPHRGAQFSTFDVTFQYGRNLDLVSPGELVSDTNQGEQRVVRRRLSVPVPFLGFNLGSYLCADRLVGAVAVKVCGSGSVNEMARGPGLPGFNAPFAPNPPPVASEPPPAGAASTQNAVDTQRLHLLAAEIGGALAFYSARLGPPALQNLVVSPIPGTFGQGFAGLIYLSAFSYLPPSDPVLAKMGDWLQFFFESVLPAHELAHQWWGNTISAATYRDEWLMEALANFSALLWLEQQRGPESATQILDTYRSGLIAPSPDGETLESAGPVTQGHRLQTPLNPHAYDMIIYGKGTWILQMLRRRLGDEAFWSVSTQMISEYRHKTISTEEFRKLCAAKMPAGAADPTLEGFFDQWVYGTGIPAYHLDQTVKRSAGRWTLTGTLSQSGVPDDFQAEVPVEIRFPTGPPLVHWVKSSSDPVAFSVPLKSAPARILLDPAHAILRRD